MALFAWIPDEGATVTHEPRIRAAGFGDGYEQRAADGMNADLERWPLTFSGRTSAEAALIVAFLSTCGGTTSFTFVTPEGGTAKSFVCKKWTRSFNNYPAQTVTAEFQQVPA